ncbi:DNA-processing protein DprA [Ruminococcaceae bacterium OttesenSCG-928-I18]|nr:DNA-processing protein DprA [Ruminococcaceae bacterium OttesenSCG-928-I18]
MAKETWMWLVTGLGFGAVNTGELLEAYPEGAEAVLRDLGSEKLDGILTQKQADRLASTRPADYALTLAHAETQGIYALPYDESMYPEMLRSITNPPLLLFVKGDLSLLNGQLSIGMVGARRPSGYGVEAVKTIGRGVALGGAIIISGLAAGLDSEAHKAALAVNGPTIACIAFGHDNCYPAQNKKLMEVIERYGAVISEYPLGTKPEKPFFLHRNRLIAGLSHAIVVTEARKHSGTMSTVNFATDYGRDVFAVPGSIFSELSGGTNTMIRDGAYLAASAADILSMYGIELSEEDLAKVAASQAQEGRPAMASAIPPWQQPVEHRPEHRRLGHQDVAADDISPADVAPGEQTMLEALQSELRQSGTQGGDRVSRGAAIDAFRKLQKEMPPTDDSELDARNRALDDMVAAVSDDVDIRSTKSSAVKTRSERQREMQRILAEQNEEKVKPFRWETLEHLTKEDVAKQEKEAKKKRRNKKRQAEQSYPLPARGGTEPVSSVGAVEPVGAPRSVTAVNPVDVMPPVPSATAAERAAARRESQPPEERAQAEPPAPPQPPKAAVEEAEGPAAAPAPTKRRQGKPAAERQEGRSLMDAFRREDEALAEKLRTLQKNQTEPTARPKRSVQKQEDAGVYRPTRGVTGAGKQQRAISTSGQQPPVLTELPRQDFPAEEEPAHMEAEPAAGLSEAVPLPQPQPMPPSSTYVFPPSDRAEEETLDTVSDDARRAFDHLGMNPVTLAQVSERSGLSPGQAMAALTELELAGLSRQLPGRRFVLIQ